MSLFNEVINANIVIPNDDKCKVLMKKICVLIWSLYRIEWWYIIKSKHYKLFSSNVDSKSFPTTLGQVKKFLEENPELKESIVPHVAKRNIYTVGKNLDITMEIVT